MGNTKARLYVGNLNYKTTERDMRDLFSQYGELTEVRLITDRETGKSKGFGFVEFATREKAETALEMDGQEFMEWKIVVNFAREKSR